jgi:FdhE protein
MTLKGAPRGAVVDPIDIGNVAQPPFVRLPDLTTLFDRRAKRLATLSRDNGLADYLEFLAALVRAQAEIVRDLPPGILPGPDQIGFFQEHKLPLLDRLTWRRDPSWQAALDGILEGLGGVAMPAPACAALDALARMDPDAREGLADRVLGNDPGAADPASACFVGAALQVYWTRMAALLDPDTLQPVEPAGACPVCGSSPVASVVYAEGSLQGVRFLCCPLCASEWHAVRIKCVNCQSTKGIAYHHVAGQSPAVKAETCDECRTYTKIVYKEKDPDAEPFADDLATVALDLLVGEAGWMRATPNPFLVPAAE